MVLPDSHGVSRVPRYSGTDYATFNLRYEAFTLYGQVSQPVPLSNHGSIISALQPRKVETLRFGLFQVRSPLLPESLLISSPAVTEMFHFTAFATQDLCIQSRVTRI